MYSKKQNYLPASGRPGRIEEKQVQNTGPEEIACCICMCIYCKPISLACKHTYCKQCIACWCKYDSRCPKCRDIIQAIPTEIDQTVEDYKLNSLMSCPYCDDGIRVKDYEMHFKRCPYLPLSCLCGEKIFRDDFFWTEKCCKCPQEQCPYCSKTYQKRIMEFHKMICRNIAELRQYNTNLLIQAELTGEKESFLIALEQGEETTTSRSM